MFDLKFILSERPQIKKLSLYTYTDNFLVSDMRNKIEKFYVGQVVCCPDMSYLLEHVNMFSMFGERMFLYTVKDNKEFKLLQTITGKLGEEDKLFLFYPFGDIEENIVKSFESVQLYTPVDTSKAGLALSLEYLCEKIKIPLQELEKIPHIPNLPGTLSKEITEVSAMLKAAEFIVLSCLSESPSGSWVWDNDRCNKLLPRKEPKQYFVLQERLVRFLENPSLNRAALFGFLLQEYSNAEMRLMIHTLYTVLFDLLQINSELNTKKEYTEFKNKTLFVKYAGIPFSKITQFLGLLGEYEERVNLASNPFVCVSDLLNKFDSISK